MKDKIIIVEGPQGVGKTTFTNYLREKMSSTDLYRLSGIKEKGELGFEKTKKRYNNLLDYMENCESIDMIFDRTFFSEMVYTKLGYKEYSFKEAYDNLLKRLDSLNCEIYLVVLYLEDASEYETRIKRDKHQYQKFDAQSSINQQNEYLQLADEVEKNTKNIKVIKFNNNTSENFEKNINKQFGFLFNK